MEKGISRKCYVFVNISTLVLTVLKSELYYN